jgi:hypothetical protein
MMHGHEKSRSAIVAVKPTNKAEHSAAEPVEPRAETKHVRDAGPDKRVTGAWLEPYAGKLHVRICAGGARQLASLPQPSLTLDVCMMYVARLAPPPRKLARVNYRLCIGLILAEQSQIS